MENAEIKLSSGHNSLIDAYRFIFICMVMLHHARYVPNAQNVPFEGGYICVEFFFILSGYLLAKSAWGGVETDERSIARDTVHEIWKRIKNLGCYLFPAYLGNFILRHLVYLNVEGFKIMVRDSALSIFELMFLSLSGINHSVAKWHGVTWYISAMFIAIFVIYPLLRKYKYFYPCVIAPLIILFIYGWLSVNFGWIGAPMEWTGIAYVGLLRSFAGLSMGVICFHAVRLVPINKIGNDIFISLLEILLVVCSLLIMYTQVNAITDYLMILLFFALVYLAFAWDGFFNRLCNNRFCHFLGKFSVALYMSHEMAHNLPGFLYPEKWNMRHMTYIFASVVFAVFDYLIASAFIKRIRGQDKR